jgi:hypothetical protein
VKAGPGQDSRKPLAAHPGKQNLQLPHEVSDEVRVAVDGLDGLDERPFAGLIQAPSPMEQGLEVEQENPRGFLQVPAPTENPEAVSKALSA